MAQFSEVEKQLLSRVTDDRLVTSLTLMREAMEKVWAPEAPRVIQHYTDHGPSHIERVAERIARLLAAESGRHLEFKEIYLLLGGLYLHDIGMQCDVVKLPAIKERAVALGAKFDLEFAANTAGGYSLEEQKEIRKWHHYLSAAWLDHAHRTGETLLGPAAKSVPGEMVDDLMDVCLYHTTRPIGDCSPQFRFDPEGRKQLVAAVLRFADELDIDSRRVSMETVHHFGLPPQNEVYWWLHSRTNVTFPATNEVELLVRLHPDDVKEYAEIINRVFLQEFRNKNGAVRDVLVRARIPFVISEKSRIEPYDREERLPEHICRALKTLQKKSDEPIAQLAEEVGSWLQAIRYDLTPVRTVDERTFELTATLKQGAVSQRVRVRCVGGEISPADVESIEQTLDRKVPEGWLISAFRRRRARRQPTVKVSRSIILVSSCGKTSGGRILTRSSPERMRPGLQNYISSPTATRKRSSKARLAKRSLAVWTATSING